MVINIECTGWLNKPLEKLQMMSKIVICMLINSYQKFNFIEEENLLLAAQKYLSPQVLICKLRSSLVLINKLLD